jgi:glyoxylase-like metal-dependent hydrolase (beta-lactamase superfamily II)
MTLDLPFPAAPAPGQTLTVAPGIVWLRMPLPFALDHINLWLIEEAEGWTLVDTGFASNKSRGLWEEVFVGPMDGRKATRLICTHFHPDHMGLADWLTGRFGLTMETTLAEWLIGRAVSLTDTETFNAYALPFYKSAGFDDALLALAAERGNSYAKVTPVVPAKFARIRAGDTLTIGGRHWEVIVGEGHSPELAALSCAELGVLISGDQILPSITPNVSVWATEPEANPLGLFLDSLGRFRHLPEDTLVLPSHGLPFRGLARRIDAVIQHHDERLVRCLDGCDAPTSGAEMIKILFRRTLDERTIFFAIGEALAHLHLLRSRGLVARETGADGVQRWLRA